MPVSCPCVAFPALLHRLSGWTIVSGTAWRGSIYISLDLVWDTTLSNNQGTGAQAATPRASGEREGRGARRRGSTGDPSWADGRSAFGTASRRGQNRDGVGRAADIVDALLLGPESGTLPLPNRQRSAAHLAAEQLENLLQSLEPSMIFGGAVADAPEGSAPSTFTVAKVSRAETMIACRAAYSLSHAWAAHHAWLR